MKIYMIPVGTRMMEITSEELYAIGNFWQHQCDREEVETAVECMKDEGSLPELEDMDEIIEFCAREYRRYLDSSSQDQYNFSVCQEIVSDYISDIVEA